MAVINGISYSKAELLRRAQNLGQIAGVKEGVYTGGRADGLRFYEVRTGGGLEYTLLPGKCLDISALSYKGTNISYLSKNGLVKPEYGVPAPGAFSAYMTGGMLFTCGLSNTGAECTDTDGSFHPTHGHIGITPAEEACGRAFWQGDDYILQCSGFMRESRLFGGCLTLDRTIVSRLGENKIEICDTLENLAGEDAEFAILYHFNFGFPFLDERLDVNFPECEVISRTGHARAGLSEASVMTPPIDGMEERCYFREPKGENGKVSVTLENSGLGIGARLCYEKENLPVLVQWKSMKSGDYALGIEPSNGYLKGRPAERAEGTLKSIGAGKSLVFRLSIELYDL